MAVDLFSQNDERIEQGAILFSMKLGLYRIIPGSLIRIINSPTYRYFGARSIQKIKRTLTNLLEHTDVPFFAGH